MSRLSRAALSLALAALPAMALSAPARAADLVALDDGNRLIRFNADTPGKIAWRSIKGTSSRIVGIDVRPADGKLYGLAADGGIYVIDWMTGQSKMVSMLSVAAVAQPMVVDFNPVADRMRVVGADGRNLRINVETGQATEDGKLAYVAGDANAGKTQGVSAGGYINAMKGATATTLYEIDNSTNALVVQDPPNDGGLKTRFMLTGAPKLRGLDIVTDEAGRHTGYAVSGAKLYKVDVTAGKVMDAGAIGRDRRNLIDVAAVPRM